MEYLRFGLLHCRGSTMNEFAEKVWISFWRSDVWNSDSPRSAFEKHVAPFLKEPNQEEDDLMGFYEYLGYEDNNHFELRPWHAALKWERERIKNS